MHTTDPIRRRPSVRALADATPPERDRAVDFLRVLAIGVVVIGHWLVIAIDGSSGRNLLATERWLHPATWVFQVMPVVFLVGGYSNAASWSTACRRNTGWADWCNDRSARLLHPTAVFLAVTTAAAVLARAAGVDGSTVHDGAWLVTVALWFLAVYLVVVATMPFLIHLHDRVGPRAVAIPAVASVVVDVCARGLEVPGLRVCNWVFVWWTITQLGVAWRRDGVTHRSAVTLAVSSGLALVAMTALGTYPVSMVNVPGATMQNVSPPSPALLALGLLQAGLVIALAPRLRVWLADQRRWSLVIAANGVAMTVYLWHLTAVVIAASFVRAGVFPDVRIASATWWLLRPAWLIVLAIVTSGLVALFASAERQVPHRHASLAPAQVLLAVPLASTGLLLFTLRGVDRPSAAWSFLAPALLLLWWRRGARAAAR
jgi:fucose 4-O-acetylase-like acetyltransferase